MKKVIISITSIVFLFGFFWYLSKSEYDRKQGLKKYPRRFAYYVHEADSSVSMALGSEDSTCAIRIREYYKTLDKGVNVPIPNCVVYSVGLKDPVYVLSDEDGPAVKVAYFYKGSSGREKYVIGYLLRDNLHEVPYLE